MERSHLCFSASNSLRVPVRSGDDRLACSQRNGQRAGNNLRLLPVRRDVDIRGAYMLHKLFRAHKAIVQNQM